MLKVFGHKAPDTDATASALIWSWYLNSQNIEATPYVLGVPNTEAQFVLERWGYEVPELLTALNDGDELVIVDTNNPAELPEGLENARVKQIIDHHKLTGGIETNEPIDITIRPLASTATIMADLMGDALEATPQGIKGLVLSCILSDTLAFRSPTTTAHDRALANKLANSLTLDIEPYADEMFAAKSDVSNLSDAELIRMDSKEYAVDGTKFRVSVLETTSPAAIMSRKESLMASMANVADEDGVDQVLLFVVNILDESATLLVQNDVVASVAKVSFGVNIENDEAYLPGVMSRKKQIIPALKLS